MNRPAPPPADDELHALVDGHLAPERRAEVEDAAAHDPALAAQVAAWRVQRDALRRLHGELLDEPIPSALMSALDRNRPGQARQASWMRWGGMAAGVLVAFGAGWLGNAQWSAQRAAPVQLAKAPAMREFVHDASIAHAVYAPEKRHPVEVAGTEQQHLVQWLSKRLDKPLKVPDLTAMGYTLVGGRLLPGESGARAQFMFEDSAGERVTLYIGTLDSQAAGTPASRETAFRFASEGPVPSFYWVDQGFGYAVAGKLPRDILLKLATLAYRDLS
ncbi:anti-sigma factor RsiW [Variovorax paradoxus]|jgi:anti-sigma factor RsiW|uniref:anti-sigma factor family protein n=1 Tax=Variovorax paradoxus TaxID=34073 RepID=UPI00278F82E1|nr:anti-sigma factor [Variovorax paradoxus]MDQ0570588.1 anti-sigma factor RsiW [Variovorax paradoxus]